MIRRYKHMADVKVGDIVHFIDGAIYYEIWINDESGHWLPHNSTVMVIREFTGWVIADISRYNILVGDEIATIALSQEQQARWRELK